MKMETEQPQAFAQELRALGCERSFESDARDGRGIRRQATRTPAEAELARSGRPETSDGAPRTIPFYRPSIGQAEIDEVVDTLAKGWLTTGPKTKQFESEFACYLQAKHAIAVNSCTAALHLALEAIGLKPGQAVLVPAMTFAATAEVVRYFHAKPLLVDCRSSDMNIDPAALDARIQTAQAEGEQIAAVLPVHYGGQIGDMSAVGAIAQRYQIKVIEDAAHCCPAYFREAADQPWQSVGATSEISCYSFYANKTITTGEGGMACTQSDSYAERMRIMSLHGISRDAWKRFTAEGSWYYEIVAPGFKYNLTDIAAAIGLHQVRKADRLHQQRRRWAAYYAEKLGDIEELTLPKEEPNRIHSWHLYSLQLNVDRLKIDRAEFIIELKRRGIGTSVHWMPLHLHPYYRETYGYQPGDLPQATALYPKLVSLPLFPDLKESDLAYICQNIRQVIAENLK
jgi:dTDP-4-amino-4,6-dideoxygalactose transaminase